MSTTETVAFVGVLVGGILLVNGAAWLLVGHALRRRRDTVSARWAEQGLAIVKGPESASYRGHLSKTVPLRGNGVIALTATDVRFEQLVPAREFVVPLADITRVVIRRTWQGSYRSGGRVVGIYYRDAAQPGGEDAIGLMVRDAPGWASAIAGVAGIPFTSD